MSLFSELLNQQIINALGWSLFHILWQGFAIAVVLSILLRFLKNKPAQLKYLVTLFSLIIIVGLSVYNFTSNLNNEIPGSVQDGQNIKFGQKELLLLNTNEFGNEFMTTHFITNLKNQLSKIDRFFPAAVNLWIFGVFIFVLKFIIGFIYTNRLKSINTLKVSKDWAQKFKILESKLSAKKPIRYIQSQMVKVPMVIGYFKPVIVIPFEMLTGMPINQVEAIIAHEIAHIRRNDYILNVLQTIIETVFFFHPAVWYISNQIRNERENCCDDLALTICKEKIVYAKALVSVQELTLKKHYSAVAFSGRQKHLLNRVKRMIMKPKVKSNLTDKIIAALIIISGILALSFTYTATNYDNELNASLKNEYFKTAHTVDEIIETEAFSNTNSIDTIHFKKGHDYDYIDIDDNKVIKTFGENGKKHKLEFKVKNGKAYDLYVDGKEIPEKDYPKYQNEIDETIDDLEEAKEDIREAMKEIEEIDYEQIRKEVEEAVKEVHIDIAEIQEEVARAMEEVEMVDVEEIMKEVEMSMKHIEEIEHDFDFDIELEEFNVELEEVREEIERAHKELRENMDMEAVEREMIRVQEELSKINNEKLEFEIQESLKEFEEHDKQEIMEELQEKLEELEKLELEEK